MPLLLVASFQRIVGWHYFGAPHLMRKPNRLQVATLLIRQNVKGGLETKVGSSTLSISPSRPDPLIPAFAALLSWRYVQRHISCESGVIRQTFIRRSFQVVIAPKKRARPFSFCTPSGPSSYELEGPPFYNNTADTTPASPPRSPPPPAFLNLFSTSSASSFSLSFILPSTISTKTLGNPLDWIS